MRVEPLLAAGNDWIFGLLTLLVPIVIWIFNRIAGQMNLPGQGPQPQQGRRQPPAGVPKPDDEVQEFLRRVRERRKETETVEVIRPAQPLKQAQSSKQAQSKPVQPSSQRKQRREKSQRARGETVAARTIQGAGGESRPARQESPRRPLASTIGEQVARDIDTSDVTERASHLSTVDQADEQMEAHIKSAFASKLGQFASPLSDDDTARAQAAGADTTPSVAAMIRTQLASPDGIRQAVLLREILDRPTHRW